MDEGQTIADETKRESTGMDDGEIGWTKVNHGGRESMGMNDGEIGWTRGKRRRTRLKESQRGWTMVK